MAGMIHHIFGKKARAVLLAALAMAGVVFAGAGQAVADPLLDEAVEFVGAVLFLEHKVPALVIGAMRDGETAIYGFGETSDGSGKAPDGNTLIRIGSITKAFTGDVLAHLAAGNVVALTDPLAKYAPDLAPSSNAEAQRIRLIELATHSAGTPREVPYEPGPKNDPFAPITRDAFAAWLAKEKLLFPPSSGVFYSNFGFDLLAIALSEATQTPYADLLKAKVTAPLGLRDTVFAPSQEQKARMMQGHGFDGTALPVVPTGSVIVGSGGLYSTPKDLLRWMQWHLDRTGAQDAEARLLDHSIYLVRDGLSPVFGMDESGRMDAMGLAWVAMMPEGNRPLILQKAGGLQGSFSYIAFAPTRGVAVFVAINKFDFSAARAMAEGVNDLITTLAPR